jgi:hypothetical protein
MQVMDLLGTGQMEPKIAGLMLYALQTASANLKRTKFEVEKPTDVVIDRDTVDRTCINGPQWFSTEFPDPVEETAAAENNESVDEASPKAPPRHRANFRKKPALIPVEEAASPWAVQLVRDILGQRAADANAAMTPGQTPP